MVHGSKSIGPFALRLLAVLALLGCPQSGSAAGTWSVISLPQGPTQVVGPTALVVDAAGNLYVADQGDDGNGRIQKRDGQQNWSVFAAYGSGMGQVSRPTALAVDAADNLYLADMADFGRIQRRDAQGHWAVLAAYGKDLGQVSYPTGLAVDAMGNLYVAERRPSPFGCCDRIQQRDAQGHRSVIATAGDDLGQVIYPTALAVDTSGNLYVADTTFVSSGRIQKRDAQGHWSLIATGGTGLGQVSFPSGLAVDTAGNLSVAEAGDCDAGKSRIQQRDAQGGWSVIATYGTDPGQVNGPSGLAVDAAGNLYVADTGNNRVQEYTPSP